MKSIAVANNCTDLNKHTSKTPPCTCGPLCELNNSISEISIGHALDISQTCHNRYIQDHLKIRLGANESETHSHSALTDLMNGMLWHVEKSTWHSKKLLTKQWVHMCSLKQFKKIYLTYGCAHDHQDSNFCKWWTIKKLLIQKSGQISKCRPPFNFCFGKWGRRAFNKSKL